MAHVITRPCCNDASCVSVCPVNCIHPTPDEPEFLTAEALYIDPETCIDCGACIDECPVEAILPDDQLTERDEPYLQINADYYKDHDVEGGLVPPRKSPPLPDKELHVAIVGAGPAAFYAAEELVRKPAIKVDMFERLPTPYGLVRAGVAPDHSATKGVEKTFASIAAKKNFDYYLNVEVGKHISHDELVARYHAVIYAVGASTDKRLGIDGEDLRNSVAATQFVAWYNGHPDFADLDVDLSSERAVVVGNGNVALDVARILVTDPDELAKTDIADHALAALRESNISEVVLLGRRGVAQAAYTNSEFLALGDVEGVDVVIKPDDLALDPATEAALSDDTLDSTIATKIRLAREFSERPQTPGNKRIVFQFLTSPVEIAGDAEVTSLTCVRNAYAVAADRVAVTPTDQRIDIETGLVLRAIGYRGVPVTDLPFDEGHGVVPNTGGRVQTAADGQVMPGLYVTGWIKRGATGGIGMNRICGQETAHAVIADFVAAAFDDPSTSRDDVAALVTDRGANRIDLVGWKAIDAAEKAAGKAAGRVRTKFASVSDFEAAAAAGAK
ncbi:FAD-dependent oxidoreductase [Gordonia sp. zg691]|uniref:ferredoxin--NADP(+) reductase n=1 Tax=Gordonia jinghuaiqii TaxID=2758710 RepID=A0A7D7LX35_9ACTN|nr:FAD-dependent oxidoreductase [Gordonia jinghuaiqii]MBD0861067.1 FAD-dependent oxidoreductase [Gordonia jinghuaiqii]MCR5979773.1 4Fe-4S dicluster domain-containing protein [Gordonia jinghuaiqii]QMT00834.1 FAD-dependent oxidoreductase [Gordonia jinghuaiqii]